MKARLHHWAMLLVTWFFDDMHPTKEEQDRALTASLYAELRTKHIYRQMAPSQAPRVLPGLVAAVATGLVVALFAYQLAYGWSA